MSKQPVKKKKAEVETTGHSWDGIEELNNPMPRWWLWCFYACVIWGLAYTVWYPAWPLIEGATAGVGGRSTRADVAADIAHFEEQNSGIQAKLVEADLGGISDDPDLLSYANNAGGAVFRTWCAQCHGSGAQGAQAAGYPSLLDDSWLWGGSIEEIHTTITHGIRNEEDPDARWSEMPAFGRDDLLEDEQIDQVVAFVQTLSGGEADAALADAGAMVYEEQCAACHMEDGSGDREQGAPNLSDSIWLYGGDAETIRESVYNARFGVMPNWSTRLSEAQIRAVATYVHGLGGGEASAE